MIEKYCLLKNDDVLKASVENNEVMLALETLRKHNLLIEGARGSVDEFFVIMLKDINADKAISAYGISCGDKTPSLLELIKDKLSRAGRYSKFCKLPD